MLGDKDLGVRSPFDLETVVALKQSRGVTYGVLAMDSYVFGDARG